MGFQNLFTRYYCLFYYFNFATHYVPDTLTSIYWQAINYIKSHGILIVAYLQIFVFDHANKHVSVKVSTVEPQLSEPLGTRGGP